MLCAVYIVRVSCSVLQVLGLLLTAWRIYIRLKIHRFWWEDAWAAVLLPTGLLWLIVQWVFLFTDGLTSIVSSWIYSIGFTSIVTTVRMSVLFSIIRIIHTSPRLLRFTYACVGFFAAVWIILVVQKAVQCSESSWHHQKIKSGWKPFCRIHARTSIFQFTIDCITVLILVVLPFYMLWKVNLPRRKRRMILSIFASSVFLAIGALFHTIGQILNMDLLMIAGINVEVALALIVCNLLVVVTHVYRLLSPTNTEDTSESTTSSDDDFTTRLPASFQAPTQSLTTVELDVSLPTSDCQNT